MAGSAAPASAPTRRASLAIRRPSSAAGASTAPTARSATAPILAAATAGPSLLRSAVVLDDKNGELIGPVVQAGRPDRGMPKFPMSQRSDRRPRGVSALLHASTATTPRVSARHRSSSATPPPARRHSRRNARRAIRRPATCRVLRRSIADPRTLQQSWLMPGSTVGRAAGRRRHARGRRPSPSRCPQDRSSTASSSASTTSSSRSKTADGSRRAFRTTDGHQGRREGSARRASRSAADVHRRGDSQRDRFPGDAEMRRRTLAPSHRRTSHRCALDRPRRCRRVLDRAAGRPESRRHPQAARRLVADVLGRLLRPPLQRADADQPVERQEPDAGVDGEAHRRPGRAGRAVGRSDRARPRSSSAASATTSSSARRPSKARSCR